MKIAVAKPEVASYRTPLYEHLSRLPGWQLKVFSCYRQQFDRQWEIQSYNFPYKISANISFRRRIRHQEIPVSDDIRQVHLPVGLLLDLVNFHPDVVISQELGARSIIAASYCYFARTPLILWVYGTKHTEAMFGRKRMLLRKLLLSCARMCLVVGSESKAYFEDFGVNPDRIVLLKNAIDLAPFQNNDGANARTRLRNVLRVSGVCYLYVGRLINLKGLPSLLRAWKRLTLNHRVEVTLILVGDGKERDGLRAQVAEAGLDNVRFVGFIPPEQLPGFYDAADVFVFPTLHETWGLVVNEAMAAGLPVICSKYAGCASDLIVEGVNGWIVDPLDEDNLTDKLLEAYIRREKKHVMGQAAQEIISRVTIYSMAEGIRQAVERAVRA